MPNHRLLIIAGPSGSGKSVLYESLKAGNHSQLKNRLDLGSIVDWEFSHLVDVRLGMKLPVKQIIHYDISRPLVFRLTQNIISPASPEDFAARRKHSFIAEFDDIAVVSLWIPAALALARIEQARIAKVPNLINICYKLIPRNRIRHHRHRARIDLYRDERRFAEMFSACLTYVKTIAPRIHLVVDTRQDEVKFVPATEFQVGGNWES